jgi:hypothetical protein
MKSQTSRKLKENTQYHAKGIAKDDNLQPKSIKTGG